MSFGLLNDTVTHANDQRSIEATKLEKLNLGDIKQVNFPVNQYIRTQTNKKQIVIHHTVSGPSAANVINWWVSTPERIATSIIIDREGTIYQAFSSKYWAYHLGIKTSENTPRNKESIAVELISWGGLVKNGSSWYPAAWDKRIGRFVANTKSKPIDNNEVVVLEKAYRGFYGFQKYTDAQIESLRQLIVFWNGTHGIPIHYNEDMWELSRNALNGKPGIYSHVSYRLDKSDSFPQVELVKMLKSLERGIK